MAYPKILREKALAALKKGHTKQEVNAMFGLSNKVLKQWEELEQETGSLEKRPLDRSPRKVDLEALRKYCDENPFATHVEAGLHFNCSERVIRYAKKKLGITRKKRHPTTKSETNRKDKRISKN